MVSDTKIIHYFKKNGKLLKKTMKSSSGVAKISIVLFLFILSVSIAIFSYPVATGKHTETDNFSITFEMDSGLTEQSLIITIENLQDTPNFLNMSTIINSTNFPTDQISNLKFYEWKSEEVNITDYETLCVPWSETIINGSNTTIIEHPNCTKIITGSHMEERWEWKERKFNYTNKNTQEYKNKWEKVPIQKAGQPYSIKKFKLVFNTPIVETSSGWGSSGKIYLDLNGELFYDFEDSSWWDSNWQKRIPLELNHTKPLTDFQINITSIDLTSGAADCADIRVVNSTNDTIPFWIETCGNPGSNSTMTIRASSIDDTVHIYLDYASASSVSNALDTFEVWDRFDDLEIDNDPTWTEYVGTWSADLGYLMKTSANGQDWVCTPFNIPDDSNWTIGYAWQFDTRQNDTSDDGLSVYFMSNGTAPPSVGDGSDSYRCAVYGSPVLYEIYKYLDGTATNILDMSWTPDTSWHTHTVFKYTNSTISAFFDGVYQDSVVNDDINYTNSSCVSVYHGDQRYQFDNLKVWKIDDTVPTHNIGAEESAPVANTTPIVSLYNVTGSTEDTSPGIAYNFTDDDLWATCYVLYNGTAYAHNSTVKNATYTTNTTNTTLPLADYEVNVSCSDGTLSNVSSSIILTVYDITKPAITIISPTNTTYATASIDLNWSADETLNWAGYELNGATNDTSIFPLNWTSKANLSHTSDVHFVYVKDDYIYSSDVIRNISVWNKTTFSNIINLSVECTSNSNPPPVFADELYIYGCQAGYGVDTEDNDLFVWNASTYALVKRINNSVDDEKCTQVFSYDDAIYVLNYNYVLHIWNRTDFSSIINLSTGDDQSSSLFVDDDYIYMGEWSLDNRIIIWNRTDFSVAYNFTLPSGHNDARDLYADADFLYSAENNDYVSIFNRSDDFAHIATLTTDGQLDIFQSVTADDNYIYAGGYEPGGDEGGIGIWNRNDFSLKTYFEGMDDVRAIDVDDDYLYIASDDEKVHIFESNKTSVNITITAQEGSNTLYVWANDTSGNMNYTKVVFTVSAAPPSFSNNKTNTTPNEDQDVEINVTITDSVSVVDTVIVEFVNNTNTINYTVSTNVSTEWYFVIDQGNYTAHDEINWTWYANDTSNNLNSSDMQNFTVVNQVPSTPVHSTPVSGNFSKDKTVPLVWFASTDADAEDTITYYIYLNTSLADSTTGTSKSLIFALAAQWNWKLTADDGYVNTSRTADWYFTIDIVTPSVSITSPTNDTYTNSDVTISGTCTDLYPDSAYTNSTYFTTIDTSPTSFSFTNTSDLPNAIEDVIVYCNDSANNIGRGEVYFTYDNINPDSVGFIDQTPINNTNLSQNNFLVNGSFNDTNPFSCWLEIVNVTGTINYTMIQDPGNITAWSYNLTGQSEAVVNFTLYCNDSVNNIGSSGTRSVLIDITNPTVTINQPTNNTYHSGNSTGDLLINVTASDTNLDSCYTNSTYFTQVLTSGFNFTNTSSITEGLNDIIVYCNDSANNTKSAEVYFYYDITKPAITITSPTNTTYGTTSIDLNWSVNETLASAKYELNGGSNVTLSVFCYQESANVSTTCGGLDTGNYSCVGNWGGSQLCSAVSDGNWGSYGDAQTGTASIYINYTKPSEALNSSLWQVRDPGATINLSINSSCWAQNPLQFRADDVLNPYSYSYWNCYNGTNWLLMRNHSSHHLYEEAMWWDIIGNTTITATRGSNTLYVYATDLAGNINSSKVVFTVDDTPPDNVGFIPPTPPDNTILTQDNYFVNVSFNDSYPDWCELEVVNGSGTINYTMEQGDNQSEYKLNLTGQSDGLTQITGYCNDTVGNIGQSSTRSITIKINPNVTDILTFDTDYNTETTFKPNETVVIRFNASDPQGSANIDKSYLEIIDKNSYTRVNNESTLELLDYFTGTNGDDAENWQNQSDTWEIWNNQYRPHTSSAYQRITLVNETVVANKSDISIKVMAMVDFSNEDSERVIFRYTDTDNYCALYMSETYSAFGIEEYIGGTRYFTEVSKLLNEDQWYELKVVVQGTTATGYLNGVETVSKTLTTSGAGRLGLGADTGWIYYDNYTVGYIDSVIVGDIVNGHEYEFNYTIPDNVSLVGVWTINAYTDDNDGNLGGNTTTITVAVTEPIIQNIITYNETLDAISEFTINELVEIRSNIVDAQGADNLYYANISIEMPNGTLALTVDTNMTNISTIDGNGYTYEYNYTLLVQEAFGTWTINITVVDEDGNKGNDTQTFTMKDTAPNITSIITNNETDELTFFLLNKNVIIRANVTDYEGADNITSIKINITAPNGSVVISETAMAQIGSIASGNESEYNHTVVSEGTYTILVYAQDEDGFTHERTQHFLVKWWNSSYPFVRKINLVELFNESRYSEQVGIRFETDKNNVTECEQIRIIDHYGVETPFMVYSNSTGATNITCILLFESNITASKNETYRLYYGNTTFSMPSYSYVWNKTVKRIGYEKWYSTNLGGNITFAKAVKMNDIDGDGTNEIIVFGRSHNGTGTNTAFLSIWNATYNTNTNITLVNESEKYWYTDNHTFGYSFAIGDVDGDGTDEIVTGGVAYNHTNNTAELCVFNYTNWVIEKENCTYWADKDGAEIFGITIADVDNDGDLEILAVGKRINTSEYSELSVWNYSSFQFEKEAGYTHQVSAGKNSEAYYVDVADIYTNDGVDAKEIVYGGVGYDGSDTLNAFFKIVQHTGTVITSRQEKSWYDNSLSETFSVELRDVDEDGTIEIITSGNTYNGVRDISFFIVWNSTYSAPTYYIWGDGEYTPTYYISGHSSMLSVKAYDIDNDNITEIIVGGFANDGDFDRGMIRIYNWNGSGGTLEKSVLWEEDTSVRDSDFFDGMTIGDLDGNGVIEIITTGRYAMTPPSATFIRVSSVTGITLSLDPLLEDNDPPSFSGYTTNTTPHEDRDVMLNVTITEITLDSVVLELTNEDSVTTTNFTGASNIGNEWYINIDQDNYTAHDNVTWYWYANDTLGNLNISYQQEFIVDNRVPTHDNPILNTSSVLNRTTHDLYCWNISTADEDDEDTVINIYRWYNESIREDFLENQSIVGSGNTTKDENWICEITPFDSYGIGIAKNSTELTILNTPPANVSLIFPGNNTIVNDTNISFTWSLSNDSDNDVLTYYLFINETLNTSTSSITVEVNFSDGNDNNWTIWVDDGDINATTVTYEFNVSLFSYTVNNETIIPSNITVDEYIGITFNISPVHVTGYVNESISHIESFVNSSSLIVRNSTGDNVTSAIIEDNRIIFYADELEEPYYINYTVKLIDEMLVSEYGNCSGNYVSYLDKYCRKRTSDSSYFYYSIHKFINVTDNFSKDYKITFVISKSELMEWGLAQNIIISVNDSQTNITYNNLANDVEVVIGVNYTGINTSLQNGTYFTELNYSVLITSSSPPIGKKGNGDIYYPVCGNGICDYGEDEINCPQDCLVIPNVSFSLSPKEKTIYGASGVSFRERIIILATTETKFNITVQVECVENGVACLWTNLINEEGNLTKDLVISMPIYTNNDISIQTVDVYIVIPENIEYGEYKLMISFSTQGYQISFPIKILIEPGWGVFYGAVNLLNIEIPKFSQAFLGITGIPVWFWLAVVIILIILLYKERGRIIVKYRGNRYEKN